MAGFEGQIRQIVNDLLDTALDMGEFDAVDIIARQLPMQMLAQIKFNEYVLAALKAVAHMSLLDG